MLNEAKWISRGSKPHRNASVAECP
jgi:hypothetical protein